MRAARRRPAARAGAAPRRRGAGPMPPGRGASAGFTLVEVMIALAILAGGLVFLLRSTASNVFAAQRAQMLTAATNLARSKMYDIEEKLLEEGFQELDQEEEGDFSEEGWPDITWKAEIIKIELPDMATLQGVASGAEGEEGTGGALGGGLLGGLGAGTGEETDPASVIGAGIMGTYYQMIADVLSEAIRKVTLTVSYPVLGETETLVVTCYFTDPAAVNRQIPFAGGAAAGGGEEEEGGGDGGGGASGGGSSGARGEGAGSRGGRP